MIESIPGETRFLFVCTIAVGLIGILGVRPANGQDAFDPEQAAIKVHQSMRERAGIEPTRILLLGTFHFKGSTTDESGRGDANMLLPEHQAEIAEVLDLLERFKPDKIVLEYPADGQVELGRSYEDFKAGRGEVDASERQQLGFRLAKRLGHETVYAADAKGRWLLPVVDITQYAREHDQTALLRDKYNNAMSRESRAFEKEFGDLSLRETLLYLNTPIHTADMLAGYLINKVAVGDSSIYPGADGFVSQWYNRNLRVYANVLRLVENPGERILVIFGAGHVPILRHLFDASFHFDVMDVKDVLGELKEGSSR